MTTQFEICSCKHDMVLDSSTVEKIVDVLGIEASSDTLELCGRGLHSFVQLDGDPSVMPCRTEENASKRENECCLSHAPSHFIDIHDYASRNSAVRNALPRIAALLAEAALPAADPVPAVTYASQGRLLIIGNAEHALPWAEELCLCLNVSILLPEPQSLPSSLRSCEAMAGRVLRINGWLGDFQVTWEQEGRQAGGRYDLVLDLSAQPLVNFRQAPPGYFVSDEDKANRPALAQEIASMVGEFEKPKYFIYKEQSCAHGRNGKTGCSACIDICSAQAISAEHDHVRIEPHLCMGCGACGTVCPTGAIGYAYPAADYTGKRVKTILTSYAKAGGKQACLILHDREHGAALLKQLNRVGDPARSFSNISARLIPVDVHHAASVGIDVWLSAICYGTANILVLATRHDAPAYIAALQHQMHIAQVILSGLGYGSGHFHLFETDEVQELEEALRAVNPAQVPRAAATFNVFSDKRSSLDFSIDHLFRHAPDRNELIALPPGAPFGSLKLDTAACTLCMSCTGACPTSALISTPELPQLRFIEKNCVQCGLCAQTCPENAITLVPRLALTEEAKKPVVLNETQPFHCIRCNKPFSTLKVVDNMLAKLAGHSAFSGSLERIRMCGDCRVVDMMQGKRPPTVTALHRTR